MEPPAPVHIYPVPADLLSHSHHQQPPQNYIVTLWSPALKYIEFVIVYQSFEGMVTYVRREFDWTLRFCTQLFSKRANHQFKVMNHNECWCCASVLFLLFVRNWIFFYKLWYRPKCELFKACERDLQKWYVHSAWSGHLSEGMHTLYDGLIWCILSRDGT